jgi:hypothetical protein
MNTSPETKEIFTALAKAQGELKTLSLNKVNPHFKSKYADLTETLEMARPILAKHGMAIVQSVSTTDQDYWVHTRITHLSGQWIADSFKLIILQKNMQGLGSAITYAKRYQAQAMLGLSGDEDDDGNVASAPSKQSTKASPPRQPRQVSPPPPQDLDQALGGPEEFLDPGTHVVTFGKFKGKQLKQIDSDQLWSYLDFLDQKAHEQGKEITGPVKVFVDAATTYLKSLHPPVEDFMSQPEPSWEGE